MPTVCWLRPHRAKGWQICAPAVVLCPLGWLGGAPYPILLKIHSVLLDTCVMTNAQYFWTSCPQVFLTFCTCFPLFNTIFTGCFILEWAELHIWAKDMNMSLIWLSCMGYFSFDTSVCSCGKTLPFTWYESLVIVLDECVNGISHFKSLQVTVFEKAGKDGTKTWISLVGWDYSHYLPS